MHDIFPYICVGSCVVSSASIYFIETTWHLGVYSMMWGMAIHYTVQIAIQVVVLYQKSKPGCYAVPTLREAATNISSVFSFTLSFAFTLYCEIITYFIVPFVLLMSKEHALNLSIWSIVIQMLGIGYFTGYSAASYVRSLGSQHLAKMRYEPFKALLIKCAILLFVTICGCTIFLMIFAKQVSRIFFHKEHSIEMLASSFRMLSIMFITESFLIFSNSNLRMIGFEKYVFRVALVMFVCLFPPIYIYITWKYKTGAFMTVFLIWVFSSLVVFFFVTRLVVNFKDTVTKKYNSLERENQEYLLNQNIELTPNGKMKDEEKTLTEN